MRMRRLATWIGFAGLALAADACYVGNPQPVNPGYGYSTTTGGYASGQITVGESSPYYVTSMPPEPLYEEMSASPGYGYVWIDGFWHWNGSEWVWVSGRWTQEQAGYEYVQPYYGYDTGGQVVYYPGYWSRPDQIPQGWNVRDHRDGRPIVVSRPPGTTVPPPRGGTGYRPPPGNVGGNPPPRQTPGQAYQPPTYQPTPPNDTHGVPDPHRIPPPGETRGNPEPPVHGAPPPGQSRPPEPPPRQVYTPPEPPEHQAPPPGQRQPEPPPHQVYTPPPPPEPPVHQAPPPSSGPPARPPTYTPTPPPNTHETPTPHQAPPSPPPHSTTTVRHH
jgi:hypothetical protein